VLPLRAASKERALCTGKVAWCSRVASVPRLPQAGAVRARHDQNQSIKTKTNRSKPMAGWLGYWRTVEDGNRRIACVTDRWSPTILSTREGRENAPQRADELIPHTAHYCALSFGAVLFGRHLRGCLLRYGQLGPIS